MSPFWEKVFFILSFITQGSSYLSPTAYAIMHRMHHAYTDTDKDPHSPSYSKNLFDMMWQTYKIYAGLFDNKIPIDQKFLKNVPRWTSFDKIAHSFPPRILFAALYLWFFITHIHGAYWLYILYPILLVMSPVHGAIINWYAHKVGYKNYEMSNTSSNLLPIDFLMLGESYHNNHHKNPSNINFGRKWHEFDPVYPFILLFSKIGIVQLPERGKSFAGGNGEW